MITKEEIYDVIPKKELVKAINEFFTDQIKSVHGIAHWMRVMHNGLILAERNGANRKVIIAFAFFHDIKRELENDDPEHGYRGGQRLLKLKYKVNLTKEELEKTIEACEGHTGTLYHDDLDISTCWDSDRLDLYRVGIEPDVNYLNNDESKEDEIIDQAMERSWEEPKEWMCEIMDDIMIDVRRRIHRNYS